MNFGFSEEQNMLRESVRRFLQIKCPLAEVRRLRKTDSGYCEALWADMAGQGWLGINIPEDFGGSGLSWVDLVVLLEVVGEGLFPSPLTGNYLAASAILENGSGQQKQRYLPALVEGKEKATVALFEHGQGIAAHAVQLTGTREKSALRLTGEKVNVMDPLSADHFVVSFRWGEAADDVGLALVSADWPGVEAKQYPLIDETKRMGTLTLTDVEVTADHVLGVTGGGLSKMGSSTAAIERMVDQGAVAITAEISGAAGRSLQISVDYANERTQFGHPIGHYQGIKHPLAEIYVDVESFRSILYYGAWAMDNRPLEVSRITSLAKAYATEAFIRLGTESIQIHGATGYMEAVDIHLYYLRSKWARPMFGDSSAHYERALALKGEQGFFNIKLETTVGEDRFREEVRRFLTKHNTPPEDRTAESLGQWLQAVREQRYVGFTWPQESGGYGGTIMEQYILKQEMIAAKAMMLGTDFTGLSWVGPAVIQFGTQAQQDKFLPDILDSKTVWCTGYSEPGVGSDLASLQCKAKRVGDEYIVNGQKIWTSLAHYGTGIYCLVRTQDTGDKHEGITCLLIPLDTPGIEVRPIQSFAGDSFAHLYNEVFFNDCKVPLDHRIGEEGDGWAIICSALQKERSGIAEVNKHHNALTHLIELAKRSTINGKNAFENAEMRRRLSAFDARIESARLNGLQALAKQVKGDASDSEASLNKLHNCHLLVEMSDTAMELLGDDSPYVGDTEASVDQGKWQNGVLGWPTTVIGGGAPNIQKNIIAERMLGLPKD